jgi:hypothetical protein
MTNTNSPIEGLSQADIDFMVANPGATVAGSVGAGSSTQRQAPRAVDITASQRKGLRPRIDGNSVDVTADRISRPSQGLAGRLAEGDAKLRAEAAARKAEQDIQSAMSDPVKTNDRLGYLERTVKRQAKQISELQKALKDVSN